MSLMSDILCHSGRSRTLLLQLRPGEQGLSMLPGMGIMLFPVLVVRKMISNIVYKSLSSTMELEPIGGGLVFISEHS